MRRGAAINDQAHSLVFKLLAKKNNIPTIDRSIVAVYIIFANNFTI